MAAMSPSPGQPEDVTVLLRRSRDGEGDAARELYERLWDELHRIARAHMDRQAAGHTLQPTALVNEAWMRLAPAADVSWQDREHFLSFASRVMRSVLVDHARRWQAAKRGGGRERTPLESAEAFPQLATDGEATRVVDVLTMDQALDELAATDPELARVVELRFFGGLAMEQTANALDVSLSTAERHWRLARMWLREHLARAEGEVGPALGGSAP
jgi:RNA polymerase sigma-70 factor (ECF subfamily)